jgi:protein-L-isoaspartate(D-aspartate) O-methyltransferase
MSPQGPVFEYFQRAIHNAFCTLPFTAASTAVEPFMTANWLSPETPAAVVEARHRMVQEQLRARGIRDERLLSAMSKVPREEFAEAESLSQVYGDYPLPIGAGQTVSQPYIVASMIEALAVLPSDRVLEIGTGTGYEAAVLGELAAEVWTIERLPELARQAHEILARLGYDNVHVVEGDGSLGLSERAPFPKILVAAAAPAVPQSLVDQLEEGGCLVAPIGSRIDQQITLVRKVNGETVTTRRELCRFVPLVGQEGWGS